MRRANRIVPTMMAVMAAAFVVVASSANGAELKFHPAPGIPPVVGRYLVTLDPSVTADLAHASAEALARAYVGQLEPFASSDVRQFAIAMLPARARTLSADSRVLDVVEMAHPDDALAPSPPPPSVTSALARPHLVPITRDTSSSGTYVYDGSGNIKSIGTDSFVYDPVGRLKVAIVQGNQQTFTYDPFGNRTATVSADGAAGCVGGCDVADTAVTPLNNNHLSAATYDDAGNVLTGFGAVYTYDGTGMVRRATVGTDIRDFVYTADDERIAVRQGASWTWTVRDQGGKVLREFTSLETSSSPLTLTSHYWSKDYVWRSGLLLASVFPVTPGSMSPTTTYHYHLDHLGTPRLVTDGNHILVGKHTYYPFGAEMNLTPPESAIELMKFTGHERDIVAATNGSVDYMHARYYNANLGRFLSVDPTWSSADLGQPQSWNRYSYVLNNPVRYTDPDGRCSIAVVDCVIEGSVVAGPVGAGIGIVVGVGLVAAGRHVNWSHVGDFLAQTGMNDSGGSGGERFAENWIRQNNATHMSERYAPKDSNGNPRPLPTKDGNDTPDPAAEGRPHTQLGTRTKPTKGEEPYPQSRTWDGNGQGGRRIDNTDHNDPKNHPNPHQHRIDPNGKKHGPEPVPEIPLKEERHS